MSENKAEEEKLIIHGVVVVHFRTVTAEVLLSIFLNFKKLFMNLFFSSVMEGRGREEETSSFIY